MRKGVGSTWTPERKALLRRDYPTGRPIADIQAEMLAMPGEPFTRAAVCTQAKALGVCRPVGFVSTLQRIGEGAIGKAGRPTKKIPKSTPILLSLSVEADIGEIREYAASVGVKLRDPPDLRDLNEQRETKNLPWFKLRLASRAARNIAVRV